MVGLNPRLPVDPAQTAETVRVHRRPLHSSLRYLADQLELGASTFAVAFTLRMLADEVDAAHYQCEVPPAHIDGKIVESSIQNDG